MIRRQLINFQNRSVDVRVGLGAFDELPRMFASAVGKPKRAMVVWNDATSERFGEVVEHALVDAGFAVSLLVLEVSPAGATLADADAIFGALSANRITCDDLVVAVGDAATCSVVGWTSSSAMRYLLAPCFRAASPAGISLLRPSPRFSRARRSHSSMPFNGLRLPARTC